MGGEERGYDGGKKVKGRKRHILVDTEGFVLKAKLHSAKVMDFEKGSRHCCMGQRYAISSPPSSVGGCRLPRGGGEGRRDWVRKRLGWSVDVVEGAKKPAPEEVL